MASNKEKPRTELIQRRGNSVVDHLRPQRWNWDAVMRPLDTHLENQSDESAASVSGIGLRNLRFFWLDGLFAAISENFYTSYVVLFALAYGATNGQVGGLTAVGNLLGAIALFPGAKLIEMVGKRKPVVVWSGGGVARFMLLAMALFPLFVDEAAGGDWADCGAERHSCLCRQSGQSGLDFDGGRYCARFDSRSLFWQPEYGDGYCGVDCRAGGGTDYHHG